MPLLSNDSVFEYRYLKNSDVRQFTGTDKVSPRLLKIASSFIPGCLAYLCNLSIKTGVFSRKEKEAEVKPFH